MRAKHLYQIAILLSIALVLIQQKKIINLEYQINDFEDYKTNIEEVINDKNDEISYANDSIINNNSVIEQLNYAGNYYVLSNLLNELEVIDEIPEIEINNL
jgi:hypothetical protein